ncbi:MAG TPA: hypothetical protein VN451_06125, partial [Chitinophagaceae bacterium]|nr:hypothetical protein [Chitinophagaceae bacterium]
MKKIFLLFGITVSVSAAAQHKDLFNIDRHIQGKLLDKIKITGEEKLIPFFKIEHTVNYPVSNN